MPVSEAQKRSAQKWDAANLDRVSIAMPKGMKDTTKAAATAAGESMNQYIIGAVEQRMGAQPAASPQESASEVLTRETLHRAQQAAELTGETVAAFVDRAVETQAQRDKIAQKMKPVESK